MSSSAEQKNSIMTPSNVITMIRICMVPVFVVALLSPWPEWLGIQDLVSNEAKSVIAVALFVLISATDWLDGYLARSRNEVTDFGKFADPLADKILVIAALLALIELQVLPSWPVLIIIIREFIVSGIRMLAATYGQVIAASWYGKAKTVTQIIAVVLFLAKDNLYFPNTDYETSVIIYVIAWAVMIVALILTVLSMLDYIIKAWPMLSGAVSRDGKDGKECVYDHIDEAIESEAKKAIDACIDCGLKVGTAESLTGGSIAAALTSISGSSAAVFGGIVSYDLQVKEKVLGVDGALLQRDGAVNSETAEQMAIGASEVLGCDIVVSATGIAGPTGEEPGKPIGTVYIGVFNNGFVSSERHVFKGDREDVRKQTVLRALHLIASCAGQSK